MLRPEHRPGPDADRHAAERVSLLLRDTFEARAERDRVRAALRPFPIPTCPALRVVK
jgi:hypothetical protein